MIPDPDNPGQELELEPANYLAGLEKLLQALEMINGQTALDKRGELRQQFYQDLRRRPGERLSEFCTRFRTLVADLKSEGVQLPSEELGWFLRDKLGLDPLRKQMLDTALAGREKYEIIEAEVLRLFKDIHQADPLFRRSDPGNRPKLTIRKLFQSGQSFAPSSGASTAPSRASVSSSASTFRRPPSSGSSVRRAYVAEAETEVEAPADEVMETVATVEEEPDVESQPLEEYLQAEAEVFAAELALAEESGVDPQALEELEANFEQAAEVLVSMKEARSRLSEVRKDRQFGKPAPGGAKGNPNVPAAKKSSGKYPCFDCGNHGHWAGDRECPKPGAGLGKKPAAAKAKQPRQVRVTEALQADFISDAHATAGAASSGADGIGSTSHHVHEASVVSHDDAIPLDRALQLSVRSNEHSTLTSSVMAQALAEDKQLVGALDSACNRTCAGPRWLDGYVRKLQSVAPPWVLDLIESVDEQENFRFGNGGLVTSSKRWRLPTFIFGRVVLIWISIFPVVSLGCLLGRDFLDAVGGILDFAAKTLQCSFLSNASQRLSQMSAGHFILPLLGEDWPRQPLGRWRSCGLDGIVELQIDPKSWLNRRLAENSVNISEGSHDQLMIEGSHGSARCHEVLHVDHLPAAQDMTAAPAADLSPQHLQLRPADHGGIQCHPDVECCRPEGADGKLQIGVCPISLAPLHSAIAGSRPVACKRIAAVACFAILLAICAISIPIHFFNSRLAEASTVNGGAAHLELEALRPGGREWQVHGAESAGVEPFPRPCGVASCVSGGLLVDRLSCGTWDEGSCSEDSQCSSAGSPSGSCSSFHGPGERGVCAPTTWSSRWST